jgi:dihydroorotase
MNEPGVHVAVKRNVVRTLQYVDIPETLHGEVMNTCFDLLADPSETVAVRVFSMTVLDRLSAQYPEIRQELKVIIEDVLEQGCTAAFRARARIVLKGK